jgi:hypothetical protein
MKIQNGKYGKHTLNKKFPYKNIFLVGSLLHAGNSADYFQERTQNLVIFYFLGTLRKEKDFITVYHKGRLKKKKMLFAPRIPLVYHAFIYFWYISVLIDFFPKKEKIYVITFHPLFFLLHRLIKFIRNIEIVFWIADFLPQPRNVVLKLYQKLIMFYHQNNKINYYLGNKLNTLMNGKLLDTINVRTVMWGIRLEKINVKKKHDRIILCFIGVVRKGHGLDLAFKLAKKYKQVSIKILGECNPSLYDYYQSLISSYNIREQVKFENRYYTNSELPKEISSCTIGIALYNTSKTDPIYYTDPGKVKTYTQFGLPVIMTNTSEIVPFIKQFKAGKITEANLESLYKAIQEISNKYQEYLAGVKKFNNFFEYTKYYDNAFVALRD